jgi:hypothetical protein
MEKLYFDGKYYDYLENYFICLLRVRVENLRMFLYHAKTSSAPREQRHFCSAPRKQWENKQCATQTVV